MLLIVSHKLYLAFLSRRSTVNTIEKRKYYIHMESHWSQGEFEDTKGVIRIRKSNDRQHMYNMAKRTNTDL
jgi:hypothetical protein